MSLISLIIFFKLFKLNLVNALLILILFLSNPQITIYHKYYDPLILIIILLIFKIDIKLYNLNNAKKVSFIYIYFLGFLLLNFFKFYV